MKASSLNFVEVKMLKGEIVKALNDNIQPIKLSVSEAFNSRIKRFEVRTLKMAMQLEEMEKQAKALLPIFQVELSVREKLLNKKVQMWSDKEYKDFEDYFEYKYISLKI